MGFYKAKQVMYDALNNFYANKQADGEMTEEEMEAQFDRILSLDDIELRELYDSTFSSEPFDDERLFRWAEESR